MADDSPESPVGEPTVTAIAAAIARGDPAQALELAGTILQRCAHPALLRSIRDTLARETGASPGPSATPEVLRRLGGQLARSGHLPDAQLALEAALALEPDAFRACMDAGTAAYMQAQLPRARAHFERAAALKPDDVEPLATLAAVAAREQRHADARALALRALALRPDLVTAHMAIARADLLEGFAESAEARMTQLLAAPGLSDAQRVSALDLRADARDATGDAAQAFEDYAARNAILERGYAPRIAAELRERRIDEARRLAAWFQSAAPDSWRVPRDPDRVRPVREHAFLLGFPRSGTTLLEKALAGHPQVTTLEEQDVLSESGAQWLADDAALHSLAALPDAQADTLRQTYWRAAATAAGTDLTGRVLIDKLPLHTVSLPLVARLFPEARILFALRDPRDVVLSCFRRRFQINAAMFEFLTLDGAAAYYDAVMTLAALYRERLPLAVHEVRHEALVRDFDGEVERVLSFLRLDWDPGVREFADRARRRAITPSDLQVARGLNADGVGQWRRYAAPLAPVRNLLDRWAAQFGYEAG